MAQERNQSTPQQQIALPFAEGEALNNRLCGETVRRVRIVEVMRRELSSE